MLSNEEPLTGSSAQSQLTRAAFLRRAAVGAATVSSAGVLLAACGDSESGGGGAVTGSSTANAPKPPSVPTGEAVAAVYNPVNTLDPALKIGTNLYTADAAGYDGLTLWDKDDPTRLVAGLATEWSSNEDATEWTFRLREGVRFQDGSALTSEAVKKTFEYYKAAEGSFMSGYAGEIASIDASDPAVAVIKYRAPFPDLARNATFLGIVSAKALTGSPAQIGERLSRETFGCGAFKVVRNGAGESATGTAFDGYWGDGPYLKEIEFRSLPDESARIAALKAGNIQWVSQVSPRALEGLKDLHVSSRSSWSFDAFLFACDIAPTNDVRVRQAIAYATDRDAMIEKIFLGQAEVGRSVMAPGLYGYSESGPQYPYDPEKARALLAEAKPTAPVVVALGSNSPSATVQYVDAFVEGLNQVGLKASTKQVADTQIGREFDPTQRRQFPVLIAANFAWINGGPFFISPGAFAFNTLSRYDDPELDALQRRAAAVADGPERLELLEQLQVKYAEGMCTLTLWNHIHSDVFAKDLWGYTTTADQFSSRFNTTYKGQS